MNASCDTARVRSRDPKPYNATTSQDDLLPIYQQEARCMWTSIARNREIVAQRGWIETIPITVVSQLDQHALQPVENSVLLIRLIKH